MGLVSRSSIVDANFDAFGIDITVTRPAPDDEPIDAVGLWLTPSTPDVPSGAGFARRQIKRLMAIRRSEVDLVPRETVIEAAERDGEDPVHWRVDGTELEEAEHVRVVLVPAADLDAS